MATSRLTLTICLIYSSAAVAAERQPFDIYLSAVARSSQSESMPTFKITLTNTSGHEILLYSNRNPIWDYKVAVRNSRGSLIPLSPQYEAKISGIHEMSPSVTQMPNGSTMTETFKVSSYYGFLPPDHYYIAVQPTFGAAKGYPRVFGNTVQFDVPQDASP